MQAPDIRDITAFSYRGVRLEEGGHALELVVRQRGGRAKVQLTPAETEELWRIRGDMPTQLQGIVPEAIWEAHREKILAVVGEIHATS